jgi:hypothetical protein
MCQLIGCDVMPEDEREEFALYCQQATDNQLENIMTKEQESGETDAYRQRCYEIAVLEAKVRGLCG